MDEIYLIHSPAAAGGPAKVRIRSCPAGAAPEEGPASAFPFRWATWERKLVRWYFEEYPIRRDRMKAEVAVATIKRVGERLFRAAFVPPGASDVTGRIRQNPGRTRLVIVAESLEGAEIPWELLHDPDLPGGGHLARRLGGFCRGRMAPPSQGVLPPGPLRILLVICRPEGPSDVPFRSIARVLWNAFDAQPGRVQFDVLRPPTFEQLDRILGDRPDSYHIVHFDGHGIASTADGGPAGGVLIFEDRRGGARPVTGAELGQLLVDRRVPVAVLNACQSGMLPLPSDPRPPEATLAPSLGQELLEAGVPGVVAMAYMVHVEAARIFMERFYDRLLAADPLDAATREARRALVASPRRTSVLGDVVLDDWAVPVLFQSAPVRLIDPQGPGMPPPSRITRAIDCPAPPDDSLIDRDVTFLQIERALAPSGARPAILLSGGAGLGKTATAVEFARWWAATSGRPSGSVIVHVDGRGWSPRRVCDRIGEAFPEEIRARHAEVSYGGLNDEEKRAAVLAVIRDLVRVLIIDDVSSLDRGGGGESDPAVRDARSFLDDILAAGSTTVVATTGQGTDGFSKTIPASVTLRPLDRAEAGLLAASVQRRRDIDPLAYAHDHHYFKLVANLLEDGRPRQIIDRLSDLRDKPPEEILREIREQPGPATPPRAGFFDRRLMAFAATLLAISFIVLVASYATGGEEWARMFNDLDRHPRADAAVTTTGVGSDGFLIECFRSMVLVFVAILWLPGEIYRKEASRLIGFGPFRDPRAPRASLGVILGRGVFVVLGLALLITVFSHHWWYGPQDLWKCAGYRVGLADLRPVPDPAQSDYVPYWWGCVLPYRIYFLYSFINFCIIHNTMFTVCSYSVASNLQDYSRRFDEACEYFDSPKRTKSGVEGRFDKLKEIIGAMLGNHSAVLLFVVLGIWFEFWFDRYNLLPRAATLTLGALAFLLIPTSFLLVRSAVLHEWAVAEAEMAMHEEDRAAFRGKNGLLTFFWRAISRSMYFKLMVFFTLTGWPLWYLLVEKWGWF